MPNYVKTASSSRFWAFVAYSYRAFTGMFILQLSTNNSGTQLSCDMLACDSLCLKLATFANLSVTKYDFHFGILYLRFMVFIMETWQLL